MSEPLSMFMEPHQEGKKKKPEGFFAVPEKHRKPSPKEERAQTVPRILKQIEASEKRDSPFEPGEILFLPEYGCWCEYLSRSARTHKIKIINSFDRDDAPRFGDIEFFPWRTTFERRKR